MELPHVDFLKISTVNNRGFVNGEIFNIDKPCHNPVSTGGFFIAYQSIELNETV